MSTFPVVDYSTAFDLPRGCIYISQLSDYSHYIKCPHGHKYVIWGTEESKSMRTECPMCLLVEDGETYGFIPDETKVMMSMRTKVRCRCTYCDNDYYITPIHTRDEDHAFHDPISCGDRHPRKRVSRSRYLPPIAYHNWSTRLRYGVTLSLGLLEAWFDARFDDDTSFINYDVTGYSREHRIMYLHKADFVVMRNPNNYASSVRRAVLEYNRHVSPNERIFFWVIEMDIIRLDPVCKVVSAMLQRYKKLMDDPYIGKGQPTSEKYLKELHTQNRMKGRYFAPLLFNEESVNDTDSIWSSLDRLTLEDTTSSDTSHQQ